MRLKKIKNDIEIINKSSYVVDKIEFRNNNDIEIEIGMGKGDFIIKKALLNPNINYVGIEKYASVLVKAIKKLNNLNLPNLQILNIDAKDVNNYFNKNVTKLYLNFSDPWPKKKHAKRRLTSEIFLSKYYLLFKKEVYIEMKTDNQNLFEYSLLTLNNNNFMFKEISLDLYKNLPNDNIQTEYEKKFVSKNERIYKLVAIHKLDNKK